MKKAAVLLILLSSLLVTSCGGGGGGGGNNPPPTVSITVSPTTSSPEVSGTVQFTATVSGSSNTTVSWQVNDVSGGNSTVGSITAGGLYTAPAMVPSPANVTVKAVAQADTSKTASATVTVKLHMALTPDSATVPAGGTQQFNAGIAGVTNTSATWQVNGITGGNTEVGTISTSGLYTAPLAIPAGGSVTIAATAQADTSRTDSSTVSVVHSNAMLSGQYAFSSTAYLPMYYMSGNFVADGSGTISSGQVDYNGYDQTYWTNSLGGTYSVNQNGMAEFTFNDMVRGTYTLHGVVLSPNHVHIIHFDSSASGPGTMDKQDTSLFNNAALNGGYTFRLDGYGFTAGFAGITGRMTADGAGNLTAGVMDVNEDLVDTNSVAFTGTYTIDSTGRGTISLNSPLTDYYGGPLDFSFYLASANTAHLIQLDYFPWMIGSIEKQTLGSFSTANLSGGYAFAELGASTTGDYLNIGRFTADGSGGVSAGALDEYDGGYTGENVAFTGNYSVASNGRGTASFTSPAGTTTYTFYMVSPSRALFVQQGTTAVTTGEIEAQSGTLSNATFTGNYGTSMFGYPDMIVAQFDTAGTGSVSGTVDMNHYNDVAYTLTTSENQPFTATYSITSNGRGNISMTGPTGTFALHLYMISGSRVFINAMDTILWGAAEKQF